MFYNLYGKDRYYMKKRPQKAKFLNVLLPVLAVSVLLASDSFFKANASAEVSPSDASESASAAEVKSITVVHEAPELLLSNHTVSRPNVSTKFK